MSTAAFKIRNQTTDGAWSLFADEGFDCAPSDVLELKLEDTPALDVYLTIFSLVDRSTGRSVVVFAPTSGQAATPTSIVTCTMPAQRGSWQLQCQVNGGIDELDAAGRPDSTVNTKSRIVAIRTAVLDLRHPLADELTVAEPYDSARVAGTLQEAIDALDSASGVFASDPVLVDATTSALAGARLLRALTATIPVLAAGAAPLSLTRRDGHDNGSNDVVLTIGRKITADAAVAVDDQGSIAFTAGASRLGRLRATVATIAPFTTGSWSLSVLSADGEIDAVKVQNTGDVLLRVPTGAARSLLCEGTAASLSFGVAQRSGTGTNNGGSLTISAGSGQAQTGGAANNTGGDLVIASGTAGTGGAGAAGAAGALSLKTGAVERFAATASGSLITLTADAVRLVGEAQITGYPITLGGLRCFNGSVDIAAGDTAAKTLATISAESANESGVLRVRIFGRRNDTVLPYTEDFYVQYTISAGTMSVDAWEPLPGDVALDATGLYWGSAGDAVVSFVASGATILCRVQLHAANPTSSWRAHSEGMRAAL